MFADVFDALVPAFKAYGCPAELYLGPQFVDQHTGTLRIVFIQTDDTFVGAVPSQLPATQRGVNPRAIATRMCGVTAELWATAPDQRDASKQYRANLAYLDALLNTLLACLQQLATGISVTTGGVAAPNNSDSGISGLGYTLAFAIAIPVTDTPWPTALVCAPNTWTEAPATAEITPSGRLDNSTDPPSYQDAFTFPVPTPEE